jgi:hypothetical protein
MMKENQKILVLEGSIRECFYLRNRPFGSCAGGRIPGNRIQSTGWIRNPGIHVIIPGCAIVRNSRSTLIVVVTTSGPEHPPYSLDNGRGLNFGTLALGIRSNV